MAPLLRHGVARRLGGSMVQRAEGAVAEGRRQLGPRLMHTEEEEITRQIQQKKEELFDVVSKAQQSIWTRSFSNRRLLQHLSLDVNHKPDSELRCLRFSKRAFSVLDTAGYIASIGVVAYAVVTISRH